MSMAENINKLTKQKIYLFVAVCVIYHNVT